MNTASSSEDEDPLQEARAYNQSIYFMVSVPYVTLGVLGFLVFRGYRAAERRVQLQAQQAAESADAFHSPEEPTSA